MKGMQRSEEIRKIWNACMPPCHEDSSYLCQHALPLFIACTLQSSISGSSNTSIFKSKTLKQTLDSDRKLNVSPYDPSQAQCTLHHQSITIHLPQNLYKTPSLSLAIFNIRNFTQQKRLHEPASEDYYM